MKTSAIETLDLKPGIFMFTRELTAMAMIESSRNGMPNREGDTRTSEAARAERPAITTLHIIALAARSLVTSFFPSALELWRKLASLR
jgi:hypothetical protein